MLYFCLQLILFYALSKITWKAFQRCFKPNVLGNLPGPAPSSFITGCLGSLLDKNTGWAFQRDIAVKFGCTMKINGLFGEHQIYTFDSKAMHHIFLKDQSIYEQPQVFVSFSRLVFGEGLFGTLGDQHRKQRKILTPVFSNAHLRDMVHIFHDVTEKLQLLIASKVDNGPQELDFAAYMSRIALELVGQAGIGHSFDNFEHDQTTHPYAKAAAAFMPNFYPLRFVTPFVAPLVFKYGNLRLCRFVMDLIPYKAFHDFRDIVDIMDHTSQEVYAQKYQALINGNEHLKSSIGEGKDVMSLLMRANFSVDTDKGLSKSELLGQMNTLIFAATDTTSNALSRVFHLLAHNPSSQDRLRREILDAQMRNGEDNLPYDTLVSLPYLDSVCRETLRVYPPISIVRRRTVKDTILPLCNPVKGVNGKQTTVIPVPKNTVVVIPLLSSNISPEIWGADASEWKPERWLLDLPDTVKDAQIPGVYSHLMTFIGGSRSCIGFKFSELEMKVVICSMIVASPAVKGSNTLVPMLPIVVERI